METASAPAVRTISRGIRRLTLFISVLALVVGPLLYLLPDNTDSLFAWTIKPSLTAAFLGGTYCTALIIELLAARQHIWALARVFFPGMLTFTTTMLIGTLLHLDKFHFGAPGLIAQATAWAWLIIYILAPPVMAGLLYAQLRRPGGDPPGRAPLPPWFRGVLAVQAVVMIGLGLALFLAPDAVKGIWPWALTPLTARAVGAWLLGLGAAVVQSYRESDWERIRLAMVGDVALGVLELGALARFSSTVSWSTPGAWLYVAALALLIALGLYGLQQSRAVAIPGAAAAWSPGSQADEAAR